MDPQVTDLILLLKRGRKNAIKSSELDRLLKLKSSTSTKEKLRDLVRLAITQYHIPIGSCSKGYFLIADKKELMNVVAALQNRANGIETRMNCLMDGFNSPCTQKAAA